MKEKIYILFILVLNIRVNLTDDVNQVCEALNNHYSPNYYQLIEQKRNFQKDMLNIHNRLRKLHCVPSLILDDKLNINAQAYAEELAQQDSKLIHSDRKGLLGENLYSTTSSNPIKHPNGKN